MGIFYNVYVAIVATLLVLLMGFVVYISIKDSIKQKRRNRQMQLEMEIPLKLPDVDGVYATVLEKDIVMHKKSDGKYGGHTLIYNVTFLTSGNETVVYSVPQELFDYINIGQRGTLATIDGEFFDFGDGEEINL